MRVLVVDGDARWREWMRGVLEAVGMTVASAHPGDDLAGMVRTSDFDLAVTDVSNAELAATRMQTGLIRTGLPLVVVSARSHEDDLVGALATGAAAYIRTPVGVHELQARLRAIARRPNPRPPSGSADELRSGVLSLDRAGREVRVGDRVVPMPRREFDILEMLMVADGATVSRAGLARALWAAGNDARTLDVHVRRLRARLEVEEGRRSIVTVRGIGFRLDREPPSDPGDAVPQPFVPPSACRNGGFGHEREPAVS